MSSTLSEQVAELEAERNEYRAERESEERRGDLLRQAYEDSVAERDELERQAEAWKQAAFMAGRTVTAEQIEAAARASYAATGSPLCWEVAGKPVRQEHRKRVRAAFRAAGFYVEGEE